MVSPVNSIAGAIKEGLSMWKTFLATRQEAYNRKQDQRKRKAINYAEKYILLNESKGNTNDKSERLKKYKERFFKYNN